MKKIFLAYRSDGLGERLRSILNALYLSNLFNGEFRFVWLKRTGEDFRNFHAVGDVEYLFSEEYLERYCIGYEPPRKDAYIPVLRSKLNDKGDLVASSESCEGFLCEHHDLADYLPKEKLSSKNISMKYLFSTIGFSVDIKKVIDYCDSLVVPGDVTAVHVRGGDIIYGSYRQGAHAYQGKTIAAPVVKHLVTELLGMGEKVILFCQDASLEDEFRNLGFGLKMSADYFPDGAFGIRFNYYQKAFFDFLLMSKCRRIIAGRSGFALLAKKLSDGAEFFDIASYYTAAEMAEIIAKDLEISDYDNYQQAYAWFSFFHFLPKSENLSLRLGALNRAFTYDSSNGLYLLAYASSLIEVGKVSEANSYLLNTVGSGLNAKDSLRNVPLVAGVLFKTEEKLKYLNPFLQNNDVDKFYYLSFVKLFIYFGLNDHDKFILFYAYFKRQFSLENELINKVDLIAKKFMDS